MKLLLKYLRPHRKMVIVSLILAAINQSFSLCDPIFFGKIVSYISEKSKLIPNKYMWETQTLAYNLKSVGFFILCMVGVAMVSRIAKAFQDYTVNTVIQKFSAKIYTDGLQHALRLPFQKFEDQRSGETLAVLEKVKTDSEKLISSIINVVFGILVSIVFIVVYSINIFPKLVLVYIVGTILFSLLMSVLSKKIKIIQKTIVKETTQLAGSTTESLRNIELVRSLGLTNQEVNRLNLTTFKILKLELKKVKSIRALSFIQGTFVNTMRQTILFILLFLLFSYLIPTDPGKIITLQFFSFFIFGPLQEIGTIILTYREAEASLQNYEALMSTPIEEKPLNPLAVDEINTLRFQDVEFQHKSSKNKALDGISFEVKKGETIAFVGPSGSGKTTLVKLLVGLYKPNNGDIYYNDIKNLELDYDLFRNQIGFVTQDTQLFSGSIKENLLFVSPQATDEEMIEALRKASANSILERAEGGLDTIIGEGGMKISGGEKQRLSIARSLLRNPKILVFDEATSALDSITEEEITNTIKTISDKRNQIVVMIAHRLSTIMHADKIYVLEKGNIVEQGTHTELVNEKGLYYAMWRQQIGERKKETING